MKLTLRQQLGQAIGLLPPFDAKSTAVDKLVVLFEKFNQEIYENLSRHSDSRCPELECSEDGYTWGLDDFIDMVDSRIKEGCGV